jgi:hypothetical protein
MAYYDALVAAWNNVTQPPPGVTGTGLTGLTTANKLAAVNAWTVTGSVPTTLFVTGNQILNCINFSEFNVLTAAQQTNVLALCRVPGQLLGGSANVGLITAGMIVAYFPSAGPTVANLTALAKAVTQLWAQANGYPVAQTGGGGLTPVDLANAGGLT